MTDVPLFDLPNTEPLSRPKASKAGTGPITYTDYKVKVPVHCCDCDLVSYEALMEGRLNVPLARRARVKRTQGGQSELLCIEHRNLRQQAEAAVTEKKTG